MDEPKNSVTNNLCDARMETINTNLGNMDRRIGNIEKSVENLAKSCEQLPIMALGVKSLEKWKENFSFPKILGVMALIATSVTTVYEFVRKLIVK